MKYRLIKTTGSYKNPKEVLTRWLRDREMLVNLKDFLNRNDDEELYMVEEK
jgi:hypothetical protein